MPPCGTNWRKEWNAINVISEMNTAPVSKPRNLWRRLSRVTLGLLAVLLLVFNGIAFLHAWAITHYAPVNARTTRLREVHTATDKARLILLGPTIRRMANTTTPA